MTLLGEDAQQYELMRVSLREKTVALARAEKVMRQIIDMEGQKGTTDSLFVARTLAMLNAYLA